MLQKIKQLLHIVNFNLLLYGSSLLNATENIALLHIVNFNLFLYGSSLLNATENKAILHIVKTLIYYCMVVHC